MLLVADPTDPYDNTQEYITTKISGHSENCRRRLNELFNQAEAAFRSEACVGTVRAKMVATKKPSKFKAVSMR